jgi:hypothetical protein
MGPELVGVDAPVTHRIDEDAVKIDDALQRHGGEVVTVRIAVERCVEVGARIRDHTDTSDMELGAHRVVGPRFLPAQLIGDLGFGEARIHGHPSLDAVTEIHDALHDPSPCCSSRAHVRSTSPVEYGARA